MSFTPLNALSAFLIVARHKSFSAASRELGVSTSTLSQAVRQLETRVGVPLLTRTSRSVALTEAGERLVAEAGPGIEQALASLQNVTARTGEIRGRVRLSVPGPAETLVLERLLPVFSTRYPTIEVDVRIDNRFVDIVAEGLDAGIRLTDDIDKDMVQVRLTPPARCIVVGAPAYIARRGQPTTIDELLEHDCICTRLESTGARWPWELERGTRTWRVPVRGPLVLTNASTLHKSLALAGLGLAWLYEPLIVDELEQGRLVRVLDGYASTIPGFFLYFPSRAQVSPALRVFVDVAREVLSG